MLSLGGGFSSCFVFNPLFIGTSTAGGLLLSIEQQEKGSAVSIKGYRLTAQRVTEPAIVAIALASY